MDPQIAATGLTILWDAIGKEVTAKIGSLFGNQWKKVNWHWAAQNYVDSLEERYSNMRMLGNPEPVPLDGIFTHVYLLDQLTALRRYDLQDLRRFYEDEQSQEAAIDEMQLRVPVDFDDKLRGMKRRVNGMDPIRQGKNLFVLGKPGAGKTTFLKYVTLSAARGRLQKIPIYVPLADWHFSRFDSLSPFIVQEFEICGLPEAEPFVEYLLESGRALILFDGLDEVTQENSKRENLTRLINNFIQKYNKNQYVVSCRIAASKFGFHNMQDVEIADFDQTQIEEYTRKWFGSNTVKYKNFNTKLKEPNNAGVRELCTTPLLLSMICTAFDFSMDFPKRRSDLYYEAVDALLRRWDTDHRNIVRDQIIPDFTFMRKMQLFSHIAGPTFERGEYLFSQDKLASRIAEFLSNLPDSPNIEDIDGDKILKKIEEQHSIFIERARGIYSFAHLTFHEYFAARYISINDKRQDNLITQYLWHRRWHGVFLLTVSMLDDATQFFKLMSQAIARYLLDEPILLDLLSWVDRKVEQLNASHVNQSALRLLYLFLSIRIAPNQSLDFSVADSLHPRLPELFAKLRGLDLALNLDYDFTRYASLFGNTAFNVINEIGEVFCVEIALDCSVLYLQRMLTIICEPQIFTNTENLLTELNKYAQKIKKTFVKVGDDRFDKIDSLLTSLTANSSSESRKEIFYVIEQHIQRQYDMEWRWDIEDFQLEKLEEYLQANYLVSECLDLAYTTNRKVILNNLLRLQ